jgi:hypothetical protein
VARDIDIENGKISTAITKAKPMVPCHNDKQAMRKQVMLMNMVSRNRQPDL